MGSLQSFRTTAVHTFGVQVLLGPLITAMMPAFAASYYDEAQALKLQDFQAEATGFLDRRYSESGHVAPYIVVGLGFKVYVVESWD